MLAVQGVVGLRLFGMSTQLELPAEAVALLRGGDFAVRTAQLRTDSGRKVRASRCVR